MNEQKILTPELEARVHQAVDNFMQGYGLSLIHILIDPLHSQELWTNVLQEGFLDLELYPASIEDEYLVGTFSSVLIKC